MGRKFNPRAAQNGLISTGRLVGVRKNDSHVEFGGYASTEVGNCIWGSGVHNYFHSFLFPIDSHRGASNCVINS